MELGSYRAPSPRSVVKRVVTRRTNNSGEARKCMKSGSSSDERGKQVRLSVREHVLLELELESLACAFFELAAVPGCFNSQTS